MKLGPVVLAVAALVSAQAAFSADHDDVYLEGQMGLKFIDKRPTHMQIGGVVGYCPFDGLGIGVLIDQSVASLRTDANKVRTQFAIEGRWFFEPMEISAALGFQRNINAGIGEVHPLLQSEVVYLAALTPSLAFKLSFMGEFVYHGNSSLFAGVGGRLLY